MTIELEFVEWLRKSNPKPPSVQLGIGDDMAIVDAESRRILVASDMLLDGVHFDSSKDDPSLIGRKSIACNLSDCAAMAIRPVAATVSLAVPRNMPVEFVHEMYRGMWRIATEFGLAIVGGDTTSWEHPLVIDVSIVGAPYDDVEPVTRSGARVGDRVYVTGPLGGSLLGHHLRFTPRVREARLLRERLCDNLHAMMDISDGLSLDLWRMCQASGVGAMLDETELLNVAGDACKNQSASDSGSVLEHVLSDGEDFELLAVVAPDAVSEGDTSSIIKISDSAASVFLYPVGRIVESGLAMHEPNGRVSSIAPKGYVH